MFAHRVFLWGLWYVICIWLIVNVMLRRTRQTHDVFWQLWTHLHIKVSSETLICYLHLTHSERDKSATRMKHDVSSKSKRHHSSRLSSSTVMSQSDASLRVLKLILTTTHMNKVLQKTRQKCNSPQQLEMCLHVAFSSKTLICYLRLTHRERNATKDMSKVRLTLTAWDAFARRVFL